MFPELLFEVENLLTSQQYVMTEEQCLKTFGFRGFVDAKAGADPLLTIREIQGYHVLTALA